MNRIWPLIWIVLLAGTITIRGEELKWYKGNTHCHTLNSDGDVSPRRVMQWYRDHGYNFLVITDHHITTEIKTLDTDPKDDFLLIRGTEVTDSFQGSPVHLNALGVGTRLEPRHGSSKVETLQNNIDSIREAGAVPTINHPNWKWAFTDVEMSQLSNARLFELYNICLDCNNFGAGGMAGMEEIWDRLLSRGHLWYGVAADDAHDFSGEFRADRFNPGTGWVMVRAKELNAQAILNAMETGNFYATIGVILSDIQVTGEKYTIKINPYLDTAYTTTFIGKNGRILQESYGTSPVYRFSGDELYVRARIYESSGRFACTQPVFISSLDNSAPESQIVR